MVETSAFSKLFLLGGRSREKDESARFVLGAPLQCWLQLRDLNSNSATHFIPGLGVLKQCPGVALIAVVS